MEIACSGILKPRVFGAITRRPARLFWSGATVGENDGIIPVGIGRSRRIAIDDGVDHGSAPDATTIANGGIANHRAIIEHSVARTGTVSTGDHSAISGEQAVVVSAQISTPCVVGRYVTDQLTVVQGAVVGTTRPNTQIVGQRTVVQYARADTTTLSTTACC